MHWYQTNTRYDGATLLGKSKNLQTLSSCDASTYNQLSLSMRLVCLVRASGGSSAVCGGNVTPRLFVVRVRLSSHTSTFKQSTQSPWPLLLPSVSVVIKNQNPIQPNTKSGRRIQAVDLYAASNQTVSQASQDKSRLRLDLLDQSEAPPCLLVTPSECDLACLGLSCWRQAS